MLIEVLAMRKLILLGTGNAMVTNVLIHVLP